MRGVCRVLPPTPRHKILGTTLNVLSRVYERGRASELCKKEKTLFTDLHAVMNFLLLRLEILCKRDWPSRTHGETTHNSYRSTGSDRRRSDSKEGTKHRKQHWRPLLLFIPLRLGLSEMNSVYNEPFKVS